MSTSWDRRIRHTTRPVKPTQLRALRGQMRKAKVTELRGLPSRNLPSEIVFRRLELNLQRRLGSPQAAEDLAKLEVVAVRYRLGERRRSRREDARRRRGPRADRTAINLWRCRRDWLRDVEADHLRDAGLGSLAQHGLLSARPARRHARLCAKERTLALKDLTPHQRELAEFLSSLSERTYRAGWMSGIESEAWRVMHAPDFCGVPLNLTAEELWQLHAMSATCGGWIVFDDVNEESFKPIGEWNSLLSGDP